MQLVACVELDWTQAATAALAAILAAVTTLQAKRRPAGKRTRATDRHLERRRAPAWEDPDVDELADVPFDWPAPHGVTPGHVDRQQSGDEPR